MFRLFCKKLAQKNIIGVQVSTTSKDVCFLQPQSLQFYSNSTNKHSPTVSYLVNKCGLSLDSAISASQKIHIKTTEKPDSVLQLFREYDFTPTQITNLITKYPSLVLADPVKTLKPKLDFFESLGLSKPDTAEIISSEKRILQRSLTNQIIPTYNFLKSFLHTNQDIIPAIIQCSYVCGSNILLVVKPNITVLQEHGVPDTNIGKLLKVQPRALTKGNDRFKELVRVIEEMGFDPRSRSFVDAVGAMGIMGKSCWEKKIEAYKSFGWSEEDFITAFKLQPRCMITSEQKIMKLMNFYLNELGLTASDISKHPNLMLISLENRIIPRCSVLLVLLSKGLIEKGLKLTTALVISKKAFEQIYVNNYQQIEPEVLKAYKGELGHTKLQTLRGILE